MRNRGEIWLQLAALLMDALAIIVGAWLAYTIRFSEYFTTMVPVITGMPPLAWYFRLSLVLTFLVVFFQLSGGMYRFPRQEGIFEESIRTIKRFGLAFLVLLAILFFYRNVTFSRITIAFLLVFCSLSLVTARTIGRIIRERLYRLGRVTKRSALVGNGEQSNLIRKHFQSNPQLGFNIIGCVSDQTIHSSGLEHLGNISQAGSMVREKQVSTLIISPSADEPDTIPRLVKACYGVNVDFLYMPEIQGTDGRPRRVLEFGGTPLWALKENPFDGWLGIVKRGFDIVVSSILFILLMPVLLIITLLVKLDSRGPIFYHQKRIGLDGREFECVKFRSMKINAESKTGPVWAKPDDARVTRVGKVLRRWCLDELPQFWNVLRGDMSLVGPRPERPEFVREFEQQIDGYHERHRVRAGLTGWAQINGLRGDTPIEERTKYDRYYVENWSLMLDLKILLLTVKAVVKGENAY